MKVLIDLTASFIETLLFVYFITLFLALRSKSAGRILAAAIVFAGVNLLYQMHWLGNPKLKMALYFIALLVTMRMLFEGPVQKLILCIVLTYALFSAAEIATLFAYMAINPASQGPASIESDYSVPAILLLLASKLLVFAAIRLIKVFKSVSVKKMRWLGLSVLPLLTFLFANFLYQRFWSMQDPTINRLLMIFTVFFVVQNILVFAYMAYIQSTTEQYYHMKESMERRAHYYSGVMATQKAVRKMKHDIRTHFAYLMGALNKSDIPRAKAYLRQLDETLEDMATVNLTGNFDVDSLLYAKAAMAGQRGVKVAVEGKLPPDIPLSPVDMSMLLGNALDNAIDATQRLEGAVIKARFSYNNGRLFFQVSNPYAGARRCLGDGRFLSTKTNGGLGTEIIRQVVEKYDGILLTECKGQIFTTSMLFQYAEAPGGAPA